ncbi:hypothetical protein [Sphingobacterium sp. DR205]|nr:hypothetical protein [Sphingobacterium sp. DR205]
MEAIKLKSAPTTSSKAGSRHLTELTIKHCAVLDEKLFDIVQA